MYNVLFQTTTYTLSSYVVQPRTGSSRESLQCYQESGDAREGLKMTVHLLSLPHRQNPVQDVKKSHAQHCSRGLHDVGIGLQTKAVLDVVVASYSLLVVRSQQVLQVSVRGQYTTTPTRHFSRFYATALKLFPACSQLFPQSPDTDDPAHTRHSLGLVQAPAFFTFWGQKKIPSIQSALEYRQICTVSTLKRLEHRCGVLISHPSAGASAISSQNDHRPPERRTGAVPSDRNSVSCFASGCSGSEATTWRL